MKASDWISTKDRLPETNNQIDSCTYCSDECVKELIDGFVNSMEE